MSANSGTNLGSVVFTRVLQIPERSPHGFSSGPCRICDSRWSSGTSTSSSRSAGASFGGEACGRLQDRRVAHVSVLSPVGVPADILCWWNPWSSFYHTITAPSLNHFHYLLTALQDLLSGDLTHFHLRLFRTTYVHLCGSMGGVTSGHFSKNRP